MELKEAKIALLILLGEAEWCEIEVDQEEWTSVEYGHQN